MIKHTVLALNEQKYVGINNHILFEEHDNIDFCKLHKNVLEAKINDVEYDEHFMALDTNFTKKSFDYIPLVPVKSFDNNSNFIHFTREKGLYYAFKVVQKDCNPSWFKRVFAYIKENGLNVEHTGYDLEYYNKDYFTRINKVDFKLEEETFIILFKKKDI